MMRRKNLVLLSMVAIVVLLFSCFGCSSKGNAHHYELAKLFGFSGSELAQILDTEEFTYSERVGADASERTWIASRDDLLGSYSSSSIVFYSDEQWDGSNEIPKSELEHGSAQVTKISLTLRNDEIGSASVFSSKESAAKLADQIMKSCGLSGTISDDSYIDGSFGKFFSREGKFEVEGKPMHWAVRFQDVDVEKAAEVVVAYAENNLDGTLIDGLAIEEIGNYFVGEWSLEEGSDSNLNKESIELMKSMGLDVTLKLEKTGKATLNLFGEKVDGYWIPIGPNKAEMVNSDGSLFEMTINDSQLAVVKDDTSLLFRR